MLSMSLCVCIYISVDLYLLGGGEQTDRQREIIGRKHINSTSKRNACTI